MKKQTTKRSSKTESAPTEADAALKKDAPEKKRSRRPNVRERLVLAALDEGLLLNATGPHTLRFLPPLVCTQNDVDSLIARLSELL